MLSVLACFACLHAYVLACLVRLRAYMLGVLVCSRVCLFGMLFCLFCFTFQCLNLKILTAKTLCALLIWTYFLFTFWYQIIKLFETSLKEAGKSMNILYSCNCSKAISIFYNLYICQKKSLSLFNRWRHNWNTWTLIFLTKNAIYLSL